MSVSDGTGIASLVVAVVALALAIVALWRGNRNTSAATLVSINDGLRQGWQRFLQAGNDDAKSYELAELVNLFELAAAIISEGSLAGVSRKLVEEYLCMSLSLFEDNSDARAKIAAMRHSETTFKYLLRFLADAKRSGKYEKFRFALTATPAAE